MAGAEENREKMNLSMQMNGFSRDFLNKFRNKNRITKAEDEEEEEDIELSLGLSLNGRFGVDPKGAAKKLKRSSSISNLVFSVEGDGGGQPRGVAVDVYAPLMRTCSLPAEAEAEAEEEWRRRKELQSMRRMEAKRKRMEKLKNNNNNNNNGGGNNESNGFVNGNINEMPSSQGSIGSQGSGSSGISDFQSQRSEGVKQFPDAKSRSSIKSPPEQIKQQPVRAAEKEAKEILQNVMLDMPCVSTKGDGPNGKKIEGFLYRYKKGEEVKIVCVCHGTFLSPAEFVKHAGGGDVAHPLRHIVVNHSSFL